MLVWLWVVMLIKNGLGNVSGNDNVIMAVDLNGNVGVRNRNVLIMLVRMVVLI